MKRKVTATLGSVLVLSALVTAAALTVPNNPITGNRVDSNGLYVPSSLGIGTTGPVHKLHLYNGSTSTTRFRLENASNYVDIGTFDGRLMFWTSGTNRMTIRPTGEVGVGAWPADGFQMTVGGNLWVKGEAHVNVLQINGADLSERFDIAATEGLEARPGMVVCIDPDKPGDLKVSTKANDKTVAGIISGAGDVKAGVIMGQKGTMGYGEHPVALTGRVYCYVDAGYGAIEPGDLLTTSNTPGHAMKVQDHDAAQGAIIGKAMTGLKEGKGLVFVLVSLQ